MEHLGLAEEGLDPHFSFPDRLLARLGLVVGLDPFNVFLIKRPADDPTSVAGRAVRLRRADVTDLWPTSVDVDVFRIFRLHLGQLLSLWAKIGVVVVQEGERLGPYSPGLLAQSASGI